MYKIVKKINTYLLFSFISKKCHKPMYIRFFFFGRMYIS